MPALLVCPLSRLSDTLRTSDARDVLTLMMPGSDVPDKAIPGVVRHEVISFSDIVEPQAGYVLATSGHVERILDFACNWNRKAPLIIHCFAGISRSPAAAFLIACALMPERREAELAVKLRTLSPSATPNIHLIRLADNLLGREGRMIEAVRALGRGREAYEGECFTWDMPVSRLSR